MAETNLLTQKKLIVVRKIDLAGSIDLLGIGESLRIASKDAKTNTIRQAARRIKNKSFTITEKGMVDSTLIIRTK